MDTSRRKKLKELEKKIGYVFRRKTHLENALIHRSFRFENPEIEEDNQRLEYLGDAVLGLATAAYLYEMFEDRAEGDLTAFRSRVTSGKALADEADRLDLGEYLRLGKGERRTGGGTRRSNLADALEAVLGAAFVDGNMKAAQKVFKKLFVPMITGLSDDAWADNPKGKLQEYCQRRWRTGPQYHVAREEGPAHAIRFTVEVKVKGEVCGTGTARNKQAAQTLAAERALRNLESSGRPHGRRRSGGRD
ncbi:MAG: ribonuclease III [Lentisphaerae bacterium]|nr:ribonuclease III [Lentisphaerota bacterium]